MFTVSPIGSCRITTPLKNGQSRHGFKLNLNRCYGYCHSPAEAIQLARFMRGEVEIPADVWPLVSRSHNLRSISAQRHDPSHLYVVELASAKELTIDGVSVQLNYLRLAFNAFFSDTQRAQTFWRLAQGKDAAEIADFLARNWSETEDQRREAEMLGRIRLNLVTRDGLRRDVETLADLLPDVLFVSHVDARKPDGSPISSRSQFISLVADVVREQGHKFYDPTDLMLEMGQAAAIEDESTGLAHFTSAFGNVLMDEWARHVIAPATDVMPEETDAGAVDALLRPQVASALRTGHLQPMYSRLQHVAKFSDGARDLEAQVASNLALARDAFEAKIAASNIEDLPSDTIAGLVEQAGKLGLSSTALSIVTRAADGFGAVPAHVLIQLADLAFETAEYDDAFEFALAAFARNTELRRARDILMRVALAAEINLLEYLPENLSVAIFEQASVTERLQLIRLEGCTPADALTVGWSSTDVLDMASYLSETGSLDEAAKLLGAWRELHEHERIRERELVDLIGDWVAEAHALENSAERLRRLIALTEACPRHKDVRQSVRTARNELVDRIRSAGREGDLEGLDAMRAEVDALAEPLPEFDLWRARVKFGRGEYGEVLKLGPIAADHLSERIGVWVLLMRAALAAEEVSQASEFAGRVVELACDQTEKLKAEAEAVLNGRLVGG